MSVERLTLLIDAGNTRIKFGWISTDADSRSATTLAVGHGELDGLGPWLDALPHAPEAAVGVNVAGDAVATLVEERLRHFCGVAVRWMRSTAEVGGVVNLYDEPSHLGTDRWISLVGLAAHTPAAAVLATFGTATTIDVLGAAGEARPPLNGTHEASRGGRRCFEGGVILPGPELMRRSLASGTAGLPYAQGTSTSLPRNTHAAISSGIAAAQAGAVLRQWRCAMQALDVAPQLYCAGGGWPLVADEVTRALACAQADLGLQATKPLWLDAPVLDGLAKLATAGR